MAEFAMPIHTRAFARAGLIGNPSDGYFGKTISIILRNYSATVTLEESAQLTIVPDDCDRLQFAGLDDLTGTIERFGYYGGVRLIKAAIKRLHDYCRAKGVELSRRNFTIRYKTDVPVRVGLAGSSAIVTATMRALVEFYKVEIPKPLLPGLILSVELNELGIGAGLQDRVIQVYEGAVFMDFDKARMERDGHGQYESLDPKLLPPLFVAFHDTLAEGTEVTHNDLRARFNRNDPEVHAAIATWAGFAQESRDLILAGRGREIGPLMNANFDLRRKLIKISPGNIKLIETGRALGAATKFAGSGGAIIGLWDGDPERLKRLEAAYAAFGATLFLPAMQ